MTTYGELDRPRVLLVEPKPQVARLFSEVLAARYDVIGICSRAGEAIERLWRLGGADVIVVDEQLAGELTGLQLLGFLAAHFPTVRRVLHTDHEPIERAVVDVVLRRPADPGALLAAVERLA